MRRVILQIIYSFQGPLREAPSTPQEHKYYRHGNMPVEVMIQVKPKLVFGKEMWFAVESLYNAEGRFYPSIYDRRIRQDVPLYERLYLRIVQSKGACDSQ